MKEAVVSLKNEGFRFTTINVRNDPRLAEQHRVRSVPTFVYIRDGQEVRRYSGTMSKSRLRSIFREPLF